MKKYFLIFVSALLIVFSCAACGSGHKDWKTIELVDTVDIGTLKIPSQWTAVYEEDGLLYIYNETGEPIISEYHYVEEGETTSDLYHENYRLDESLRGAIFSNNMWHGIYTMESDGEMKECVVMHTSYTLDFETDEGYDFYLIVWDPEISEDLVKEIASTFVHYDH